jgi:aromatic-L-amino-acid decarboxylase
VIAIGLGHDSLKKIPVDANFSMRADALAKAITEDRAAGKLAQRFAGWVDAHPDFERLAPVPFSVVCFRWKPAHSVMPEEELDAANERLVDAVNRTGEVFLSHARVNGRVAPRIAIGHLLTREEHVRRAWDLLREHAAER